MQSTTSHRRTWSRALTVALAAALAAAPVASAAPRKDDAQVQNTPSVAGKWALTAVFGGQAHETVVHFTPKGRAFLASGGTGNWFRLGGNRFAFHIAEPMKDAQGTLLGWVDIRQSGTFTADTFTTTGQSRLHDQNDEVIVTVQADDTGARL